MRRRFGPRFFVFVALAVALALALAASHAGALIRLNFTPTHLVNGSDVIAELEISCSADGSLKVGVPTALKGTAPAALTLTARGPAGELLREVAAKPAAALVFLVKDISSVGKVEAAERPVGVLHAANSWFSLYARDGGYDVRADVLDLKTVWAGSTEMLARGVRYVLADPRADFPVRVGVRWRDETAVGKINAGVCGLQPVELVPGMPPALFVQSTGGDRLYQYRDGAFAELTAASGLASKSKRAAWTGLDADGRLDLVSWDGAAVTAWRQAPEGRFAPKGAGLPLAACTGLAAVRVGQPAHPAMACGTDSAVLLLTLGEQGLTVAQKLSVPEAMRATLGAPGPVVAADFDNDGWTDLAQVYEQGLVVWPGTATGGFGDARLALSGTLGKDITAADVGDLDGDGLLEIVLAGRYGANEAAGVNILANRGGLTFAPAWNEAGETYKIQTRARTCQVCDINADGRPDIMIAYERATPAMLFSRGFRTFGTADELSLGGAKVGEGPEAKELLCGEAFNNGAPCGAVADFDGDGAQDAAFATAAGDTWVVWRERGPNCLGLLLSVPPGAGPVRVSSTEGKALRGALLALPGRPAYLGIVNKGPVRLAWAGTDSKPRTRDVLVTSAVTRVTLSD